MDNPDIRIGQNVAKFRGDKSQKEVATKMRERGWKWSQATVWSTEKGDRPLRLAEAEDLAEILGCFAHDFNRSEKSAAVRVAIAEVSRLAAQFDKFVEDYTMALWSLALTADDADSLSELDQESVEEWMQHTPVVAVREATELAASRERADYEHFTGGAIDDEQESEIRQEAVARRGPYQKRLIEHLEQHG